MKIIITREWLVRVSLCVFHHEAIVIRLFLDIRNSSDLDVGFPVAWNCRSFTYVVNDVTERLYQSMREIYFETFLLMKVFCIDLDKKLSLMGIIWHLRDTDWESYFVVVDTLTLKFTSWRTEIEVEFRNWNEQFGNGKSQKNDVSTSRSVSCERSASRRAIDQVHFQDTYNLNMFIELSWSFLICQRKFCWDYVSSSR